MRGSIYSGISFNGKHSFHDYGLFLMAPPDYGVPQTKEILQEIPGRDEPLDFTEAATGEAHYSNRQQTYQFKVRIDQAHREELKDRIRADLHGKMVQIIPDEDPEWYYTGRASVAFANINYWTMQVIVTVNAHPYKLSVHQTILTVEPSSFAAENIALGKGTAPQSPNSIFTFGTAQNPLLDLTQFSRLLFRYEDERTFGTPIIQIEDAAGNVFETAFEPDAIGTGFYQKTLAVNAVSGITKSAVYRILCQGRAYVELIGTTTASASIMVQVDRMTVVPILTASAPVTALVNGRKFALAAGANKDYNLRLPEGENQVSFIADSANTTIQIQYQDGRV